MATPSAFEAYALLLGQHHTLREWLGPTERPKETAISPDMAFAILGYWASHEVKASPYESEAGLPIDRAVWILAMDSRGKSADQRPAITFSGPTEESVRSTIAMIDENVEWTGDPDAVVGARLFERCKYALAFWRGLEKEQGAAALAKKIDLRLAEKAFPPPAGSHASRAYEAAKVSDSFLMAKMGQWVGDMERSSYKSFLIKLKDKRFHLHRYEEFRQVDGDMSPTWIVDGDVVGQADFCDIDDMGANSRFVFLFVVPLASAMPRPKAEPAS